MEGRGPAARQRDADPRPAAGSTRASTLRWFTTSGALLDNINDPAGTGRRCACCGAGSTARPKKPGPVLRRGHIPGSRNLPYERVTDPGTGQLRSAEELSELFRGAGVDLDRPVVTSCGSGVTACALAFALHLIGHPGAAVYDGVVVRMGDCRATPRSKTGPAPAKTP